LAEVSNVNGGTFGVFNVIYYNSRYVQGVSTKERVVKAGVGGGGGLEGEGPHFLSRILTLGKLTLVFCLEIRRISRPQQFLKWQPGSLILSVYLPHDKTTTSSLTCSRDMALTRTEGIGRLGQTYVNSKEGAKEDTRAEENACGGGGARAASGLGLVQAVILKFVQVVLFGRSTHSV